MPLKVAILYVISFFILVVRSLWAGNFGVAIFYVVSVFKLILFFLMALLVLEIMHLVVAVL